MYITQIFMETHYYSLKILRLKEGGIYASRSTIYFMGDAVMITNNSAMDGGGLLLSGDSEQLLSKVQLFISLATSLAVLEVRSR